MVNSVAAYSISIDNNKTIKQVNQHTFLSVTSTKEDGIGTTEIKNRLEESRQVISCLSSIWGIEISQEK